MLVEDIIQELMILRDRQDNIDMRTMSLAGVDPKKVPYYKDIINEREKKDLADMDIDFDKIQEIANQKAIEYKNMFHKKGSINGS